MKKQTAVEWLHCELDELEMTKNKRSLALHLDLRAELFQQAKAMERNQIMIAHYAGESPRIIHNNSIDYYTSTYGN